MNRYQKRKNRKRIEKEYAELMEAVRAKDFYTRIDLTNRINCYTCPSCGHITKTRDIAPGVIPMFHNCEKCNFHASSSFFEDIAPALQPSQEWYRPTLAEVLNLNPGLQEHILSGGLCCRKIEVG